VVEGHSGPYIVYKSEDPRAEKTGPAAVVTAAPVDEPRRATGSNH
jgi:hypothetical protein